MKHSPGNPHMGGYYKGDRYEAEHDAWEDGYAAGVAEQTELVRELVEALKLAESTLRPCTTNGEADAVARIQNSISRAAANQERTDDQR